MFNVREERGEDNINGGVTASSPGGERGNRITELA